MELFLGVDGGQSSTTALIGDARGRVLGTGVGGPCNHVGAAEGAAKLTATVRECVVQACDQAGLDAAGIHFRAACFGMSGGPADKEALLSKIIRAERLVVTHDGMIALSGAMAGKPGIIAIAGTGSMAFGRNAEGRTARAGGWGYIFGDEGGGFDIVRQAVRALLRGDEGWGEATALRPAMLPATETANANDLLHVFYTDEWPRSRVAALARVVDDVAMRGDAIARSILQNAAQQLASLAGAVRLQLWKSGEPVRVAYIGGVFRSQFLLERFRLLVELEDGVECGPPAFGPAAGALLEAYGAAGLNPALKIA
jgi:N-acetylglucosamine kinase-like BadF-type ATPase